MSNHSDDSGSQKRKIDLSKQTHYMWSLQDDTNLTHFLIRQTNNYGYLWEWKTSNILPSQWRSVCVYCGNSRIAFNRENLTESENVLQHSQSSIARVTL